MWHCNSLFGFSGMGGAHPWGWIFQLLFWGALILFILWAVKRVTHPMSPSAPIYNEAASILDTRFARGDLTPEEYRQAKQTLTHG
ncbi:SHOCT domain-containing protein [Desulfoluna sp.]|uniref:SHOCT domain-containing protein n=1 Tax=Desulfoluna sp. TaxID=2045199 RepID=UPI00261BC552|nr:SHOCT domain-containing protein [Desulfoluna sp.]